MWKNYLTVALRSIAKNRLFTGLNLIGLAAGMAACALISIWVRNELSYDRWVPEGERVFVVQSRTQYPARNQETWTNSPAVMLPLLKQDFTQIEAASRLVSTSRAVRNGTRVESQPVLLVDPEFFDVLPWPLREGETKGLLAARNQLVITERFAENWFGRSRAMGQTLTVTVKGEPRSFVVGAIMRDPPPNSSLDFDVVMPFIDADLTNPQQFLSWGNFGALSLVKLTRSEDEAALTAGADAFVTKHNADFMDVSNGFFYRPRLMKLTDAHLNATASQGFLRPAGDIRLVAAVAGTGALILIIAMITYINLATARVSLRAREVGLRKTLGAERHQLLLQFLVESTLLAAFAGLIALAVTELTLPLFNTLLGQRYVLQYFGTQGILLPLVGMVIFVGLIGGWYPAVVLARLRPREAIAGNKGGSTGRVLRLVLVIGQFSVAVLLITCMAVIYSQVSHLRSVDMGYQSSGLIVVSQLQRTEVKSQQKSLLDAFRRVPGVISATRSLSDPTNTGTIRQPAYLPGVPDSQAPQISVNPVDWDYLKTYGGKLLAGRDLNISFGNDEWAQIAGEDLIKRGGNVLINRAALKFFNTTDPAQAVGKTFQLGGGEGQRITVTVVGVIENMRLRSARDEVLPSYFARNDDNLSAISVRFDGVTPAEMTTRLGSEWKRLLPDTPFVSKIVLDAIDQYYQKDAQNGGLFASFAAIAVVLCGVGLYGLAVFTSERRTKEIGIRKVLGASVGGIVRLLIWEFSKPVLIATLIAWPAAWFLMRTWLNGFDLRITLTPWPFIASGAFAVLIAWATVGWHAMSAARKNPIIALRHES